MAVIDRDHSYLKSEAAPVGVKCVFAFLAFWVAFLAAVWGLHALVDQLF